MNVLLFLSLLLSIQVCYSLVLVGPTAGVAVLLEEGVALSAAGLGAPCIAAEVIAAGAVTTEAIVAAAPLVGPAVLGTAAGSVVAGVSAGPAVVGVIAGAATETAVVASTGSAFLGLFTNAVVATAVANPVVLFGGIVVLGAAESVEVVMGPPAFWDRPVENCGAFVLLALIAVQNGKKVGKFASRRSLL